MAYSIFLYIYNQRHQPRLGNGLSDVRFPPVTHEIDKPNVLVDKKSGGSG